MKGIFTTLPFLLFSLCVFSQSNKKTIPLTSTDGLIPVHVAIEAATYQGKKSLRLVDTARGITGETKYVRLKDIAFHNGTIEVELAGKPVAHASGTARGFVGIMFRMDNASNNNFECFYLRPANGRAEDQVRRNHSVQYVSHPDYPWERLRKETPEKYESYADLEVGKWTKVKIVVEDSTARLYVNGAEQPTLLVLDLKHGAARKGSIGLWIGPETEAYFRNLVVTKID
ncbi:MAG TPA: family 16 glycoside hydrolase [Flavisolibacter sp.]|jgi:hypothetical protein|nr:family 16 glycoside hydrolase [Flavisolibacter sp.]